MRSTSSAPTSAASAATAGNAPPGTATELLKLSEPEMKLVGRFTCRACKLYCSIDRFEVAGRRFPFGGRCSRYESVWKRRVRAAPAPDLVEQRTRLLFGGAEDRPAVRGPRIGIPRALTTHSLHPLYATFFSGLGLEVVLSDVDPGGALKAYSGFCFPVQIVHGAVLDLARRGVSWVFLPHLTRMPQPGECRDSYLCPITQAGPYFLAKAFPEINFLSPLLDFTNGYAASLALVEMAVRDLGTPRGRSFPVDWPRAVASCDRMATRWR